jgi:murein DD-endopeptidase MepM/ murein hydrolase activator NlpD
MYRRIQAFIGNLVVVLITVGLLGGAAYWILTTDFVANAPEMAWLAQRPAATEPVVAEMPAAVAQASAPATAVSATPNPSSIRLARPTRCTGEIWGLPVRSDAFRITATFGFKRMNSAYTQGLVSVGGVVSVTNGIYHPGVDLAADVGDPIYAVTEGRVVRVGYTDQYGKHIVIDDGANEVLFGHLSQNFVRKGDRVYCGQLIGLAGGTGKALTGPHLHIEMRDPRTDKPLDPLKLIEAAYAAVAK